MAWTEADLRAAARALRRRSRRADARPEVRAGRRAGVQPRRAAGALRRRADLPDRAAPAGRSRRRRTSPASTWRSPGCRSISAPSNRAGTRFGPRAVRTIERVGPYNHVLDCAPIHDLAVADVGDVPFSSRYDIASSHREIEAWIAAIVGAGGAAAVASAATIRSPIRSCGRSAATGRSGSCTSTRIPTPAGRSTGCARTTARRSATRCWPACSIRRGRSRSGCAGRRSISTSSPPTAA